MLRNIPVADGTELLLNSNVSCIPARNGYFLSSDTNCLFAESDFEACISVLSAEMIVKQNMARPAADLIFHRPELGKAIFGWDAAEELDKLTEFFDAHKQARGLDVACGYGRLLIPLSKRGFTIDGIDISSSLVTAMAKEIPEGSDSRAMVCDVSAFASPGGYEFAYAAMNSLRFLETKFALKRHFKNMETSLVPGSPYAFCITLHAEEGLKYRRAWDFEFENEKLKIDWIQEGYCHLKKQILERIEIRRIADGKLIHSESQIQGDYNYALLAEILKLGSWKIEETFDLQFRSRTVDERTTGSFWFLVRRA